MPHSSSVSAFVFATALSFAHPLPALADDGAANALFVEAVQSLRGIDEAAPPATRLAQTQAVIDLLERIVTEHPTTDLAVKIITEEPIGTLDVAALRAEVAALERDMAAEAATAARAEGPMLQRDLRPLNSPAEIAECLTELACGLNTTFRTVARIDRFYAYRTQIHGPVAAAALFAGSPEDVDIAFNAIFASRENPDDMAKWAAPYFWALGLREGPAAALVDYATRFEPALAAYDPRFQESMREDAATEVTWEIISLALRAGGWQAVRPWIEAIDATELPVDRTPDGLLHRFRFSQAGERHPSVEFLLEPYDSIAEVEGRDVWNLLRSAYEFGDPEADAIVARAVRAYEDDPERFGAVVMLQRLSGLGADAEIEALGLRDAVLTEPVDPFELDTAAIFSAAQGNFALAEHAKSTAYEVVVEAFSGRLGAEKLIRVLTENGYFLAALAATAD